MEKYLLYIQNLMQIELNRSLSAIQFLQDYYSFLDLKEIADIPENYITEIVPNIENLPNIENNDDPSSFPRIEKLYSEAIRLFNGEEEEIPAGGKKGGFFFFLTKNYSI